MGGGGVGMTGGREGDAELQWLRQAAVDGSLGFLRADGRTHHRPTHSRGASVVYHTACGTIITVHTRLHNAPPPDPATETMKA